MKSGAEDAYRLVYSYLVEPLDNAQEVVLNDEHSELAWVSKEELMDKKYNSLLPEHIQIIKKVF